MVPLVMTAAFGAAKLNEQKFLHLRKQWQELRSYDSMCCSIDLSWHIQQMANHRMYGENSLDRAALVKRFCTLQRERNSCMQKIIACQGQLPFARFPLQTIAKVKECWALRSRFKELNRTIDSALHRGQYPQLTGQIDALPTQVPRAGINNLTFLANSMTSWSLAHTSNFRWQNYQNCISHLKKPHLDALNAQLQFLHKESVEQVWGQLIKRSERLMIAVAILQSGFGGSIRLGLGSIIAASCSKQLQAQELARFFLISSRIFGIASLVTGIAMGLAVRSYGNLLRENRAKMTAINQVKELMESAIRTISNQRFVEIVKSGLCILERQERKLERLGRRIAQEGQQIEKREERIQELKDKSDEQQLHLQNHRLEFDEHKSTIATQQLDLDEQKSKIAKQRLDLDEQKSTIANQQLDLDEQKSTIANQQLDLDEQKSKLTAQDKTIADLVSRFKAWEDSLTTAKAS